MSGQSPYEPSHIGLLLGGRYRLLHPLGAGGMAVVWKAHDHVLARTVAVKVVAPRQAGDERARKRIRHEARAAGALSHPNVAQVYDYGEMDTDGQVFPYVVMELVPGSTLLQRLRAGRVPPEFAMRIGAEIAAGLAAAHAEGLVHRDIKPANVMLSPTGAKVVDFGIAAAMSSGPAAADSPAAPESPFGGPAVSGRPAAFLSSAASVAPLEDELLGTPAYLAPERLASDQVVPASDVYALGVVLYRLFSGRTPWNAENTRQMLEAHIYVEPAPLPPVPGVPDTVAELCDRCLAKDPAARPTAQEAAAVLARGAGLRVVADEPRPGPDGGFVGEEATVLVRPKPPAARPAGRRRAVLWTTAAAVLTLAAAGGWALLDRPGAELSTAERPTAAASASPGASGSVAPKPGVAPTGSGGKTAQPARSRPAAAATGRTTGPAPTGRVTSPAATGPATTSPTTTPATTPPPADAEPVRFTSTGGSIEATCPSSTTAEILSWDPASPYKVQSSDPGPGRSPTVVFKHGNRLVTMTVTCSGGVPALA